MSPSSICKSCGKNALPGQEYCLNCKPEAPRRESPPAGRNDRWQGGGGQYRQQDPRNYSAATIPGDCIIRESFYDADGYLKADVFVGAAERTALEFLRAQITQTSLRKLFDMAKQTRLRCRTDRDVGVGVIREAVGRLVVQTDYQVGRGIVKPVFRDWLTLHRDIAMSSVQEYCAFVDFFESVVARLKDKEDRR